MFVIHAFGTKVLKKKNDFWSLVKLSTMKKKKKKKELYTLYSVKVRTLDIVDEVKDVEYVPRG